MKLKDNDKFSKMRPAAGKKCLICKTTYAVR